MDSRVMVKALALGFLSASMSASGTAFACDGKYIAVEKPELERSFQALENDAAKKTDRVFAFKTVVCSNEPEFRRLAIEAALTSKDTSLRALGLAELLMQRERIRVDLAPSANLDPETKRWVDSTGGVLNFFFGAKDRTRNCIVFGTGGVEYACDPPSLKIDGLSVRLATSDSPAIIGDFRLEPENFLKGQIKYGQGIMPAKIELVK